MKRLLLAFVRFAWPYALTGAAALLLFAPAVTFHFVNFDDPQYVTDNAVVRRGLTMQGIAWSFGFHHWAWHPLTFISHMADVSLFGLHPAGHHAVSIVLHGINAMLVVAVLRGLTGRLGTSLAAALLFAVHPLRAESVAWVAERKDVLCMTFGLLAMLAYANYAKAGAPWRWRKALWYTLTLLAMALSLMSKAMFVTLPALLLVLDVWPLRRIVLFASPDQPRTKPRELLGLLAEKVPMLALSLASVVLTLMCAANYPGGIKSARAVPMLDRLGHAALAYTGYLGKLLLPVNLSVLYPLPGELQAAQVAGSVLLLVVITALVLLALKRWPFAAAGWFWFLGTLVPVIGLVQSGDQSMADRFTYLPGLGITIVLVWTAASVLQRFTARPWIAGSVLTVLATAILGAMTFQHLYVWRDSESLFTQAVRLDPGNKLAWHNLGHAKLEKKDRQGARAAFERAEALDADFLDAVVALARVQWELGQHSDAGATYERALRIVPLQSEPGQALAPEMAAARNNLGAMAAQKQDWPRAAAQFKRAAELQPGSLPIRMNLVRALLDGGDREAARLELQALQQTWGGEPAVRALQQRAAQP